MGYGYNSAPPPEPELHWQEALFRRQFDDQPIDAQLHHLHAFLPRLLPLYAAYYFFRTRAYVLHPGVKLGVDYVVYPAGGAPRWHAQFAVLVGPIEPAPSAESSGGDVAPAPADPHAQIDNIVRSMRISFNQKKSCLYVRIFCTPDAAAASVAAGADSAASAAPASNPSLVSLLSRCSVRVTLLREWFVSKGRGAAASGTPQQKQIAQSNKIARKQENKQKQQQQQQGQQQRPAVAEEQQSKRQKVQHAAKPADVPAF
jgi:hypothetical protein